MKTQVMKEEGQADQIFVCCTTIIASTNKCNDYCYKQVRDFFKRDF